MIERDNWLLDTLFLLCSSDFCRSDLPQANVHLRIEPDQSLHVVLTELFCVVECLNSKILLHLQHLHAKQSLTLCSWHVASSNC